MSEIPKDMRFLLFGRGARWMAWCGVIFAFLADASFVVGIIGDAANKKPALSQPIGSY